MKTSATAVRTTRNAVSLLKRLRANKLIPLLTLLVLLAPMLPRRARADVAGAAPTGQPGLNDPTLGIPETSSAVANGAPSPISVNPSTGIGSSSIPFQLPIARGRSQPRLSLDYSSNAGVGNGGWGWSLTVPSIARAPLAGPPTYAEETGAPFSPATGDRFAFNGQPLVPICTVGTGPCANIGLNAAGHTESFPAVVLPGWMYFRLETAADDARFFWSANHQTWLVQYKSGETLELGASLDQADSVPPATETDGQTANLAVGPIYRWLLVRQYDSERSGSVPVNRILYYWSHQPDGDGLAYLTDVYYTLATDVATTSPASLQNFADHVHLVWGNPEQVGPVIPLTVFQPPVSRLQPYSLLTRVDISAAYDPDTIPAGNGTTGGTGGSRTATYQRRLVRRYWMTCGRDYDYLFSNRTLLQAVQIEGRCATPASGQPTDLENSSFQISATTNCPMLPVTRYGYSTPQKPQFAPTTLAGAPNVANASPYLFDFNSDGIPDVVSTPPQGLPPTQLGSTINILGSKTADTFQPAVELFEVIPVQPGFSYPPASYPPNTYGTFSNNNTPAPPAPITGNFAADGNMNILMPGSYANTTGLFQFSLLTPAPYQTGYVLQGLSDPTLQFWQLQPTSNCCSNADFGEYMYAENIFAIADVDGDGFQDAITDTEVEGLSGPDGQFPGLAPSYTHLLSLRTTTQSASGVVSPFQRSAANGVSGTTIPNYYSAALGNVAAPLSLPANGQYVAEINVGTDVNPAPAVCVLFGEVCPDVVATGQMRIFFSDVNGDGMTDWVVADPTGTTSTLPGYGGVSYAPGHGDGTFGICYDKKGDCSGSDRFAGVVSLGSVPSVPSNSQYLFDDVTGDGFPDMLVMTTSGLTLYLNERGVQLDGGHAIQPPVAWSLSAAKVFFGDINGSGVDDIVVFQGSSAYYVDVEGGARPGLLTQVTNGYGAVTEIYYESTHSLSLSAAAAGNPWSRQSPQILHHVTQIVTSSPLSDGQLTTYSYRDPVYDGRNRQFAGFRTVTTLTGGNGDVTEPIVETTTRFLTGMCAVDNPGATCPAPTADQPFLSLRARPAVVDTYDQAGHHLSTVHNSYHVSAPFQGLDGRGAHFAYSAEVDSYVYDASVVASATTTTGTGTDVTFDGTTPSVVSQFPLYASSPSGYRLLETTQTLDSYGRQTDAKDYGVSGQDATLEIQTPLWQIPPGDPTNWQWRPSQQTRAAATGVSGDLALTISYEYYADGQIESSSTTAAGEVSVTRMLGGVLPGSAVSNGTVIESQFQYDIFGQPSLSTNGPQCAVPEFDADFDQLPTSQTKYRDGCATSAMEVTSQRWDRGLEKMTLSVGADNASTSYGYDGFGQLTSVVLPNPTTGLGGDGPTISIAYSGTNGTGATTSSDGYGIIQSVVTVSDATNASFPSRQIWRYADPWGRPLFTAAQADPSAGDGGNWIINGFVQRNWSGAVKETWAPFFSTVAANAGGTIPAGALPKSAYTYTTYDAFGRVMTTVGLDEKTVTSSHVYRLASVASQEVVEHDVTDAAGALAKLYTDGHGRTSLVTRDVHNAAGALDEVSVRTIYSAAGKPVSVTQSHTADAATVTRSLAYDSLGRLVSNLEPNTSRGASGWLYEYDVSGNVVGTSDARGCGENLVYDGLGRLRWEDYQPCTSLQAPYTAAPSLWITAATTVSPTTISGVETLYSYEAPGATLLNNRLTSVADRGAYTSYLYDGRGRIQQVSRQLAAPSWTSAGAIGVASNYATNLFTEAIIYDGLDRVTQQTSGGVTVSGTYSLSGNVSTVGSTYGAILQSNVVDADGSPLTAVLGDVASTTTFQCYDSMRRLVEYGALRNTSLPSCAHARLGSATSSATPAQTVLIDDAVTQFDAVGNPKGFTDKRVASEWGTGGAFPVNRTYTYDDSYRLTQASFGYVSPAGTVGADTFSPALPPESDTQTPLTPQFTASTRVASQTFAFDWLGNRAQTVDDQNVFFERSLGTETSGGTGFGPNQLSTATEAGDTISTAYDAAGNLTSLSITAASTCTANCSRSFAYEWDELGQLATVDRWTNGPGKIVHVVEDIEVKYRYDSAGNRVLRSSYHEDTGATSYNASIYPSLSLVGSAWNSGTGSTGSYQADPTVTLNYLVFAGVSYGQVFTTLRKLGSGTNIYTPHVELEIADSLGSTSAVIDQASGDLMERTTYYPYGGVESDYQSSAEFWEDYKFTGKEGDNELGLIYFGARYYSPNLGRWLSPDPAYVHGLQSDRNPYAYVYGRVTTEVDSFGLSEAGSSDWNDLTLDEQGEYFESMNALDNARNALENTLEGLGAGATFVNQTAQTVSFNPNGTSPIDAMLLGSWRDMTWSELNPATASRLSTVAPLAEFAYNMIPVVGPLTMMADPESTNTQRAIAMAGLILPELSELGALGRFGAATEGLEVTAVRRLATAGDTQFRTAEDALAEALERHGIDPSTIETTTMYGKNPNLIGPQGQPWEMVRGLNADGELIEFEHHANGHFFDDTGEFELPHYHGPNGEHLTY